MDENNQRLLHALLVNVHHSISRMDANAHQQLNDIESELDMIERQTILLDEALIDAHAKLTAAPIRPSATIVESTPSPLQPPSEDHLIEDQQRPTQQQERHPAVARYQRLLKLGAPMEQIRQRMALEGLDPALLE